MYHRLIFFSVVGPYHFILNNPINLPFLISFFLLILPLQFSTIHPFCLFSSSSSAIFSSLYTLTPLYNWSLSYPLPYSSRARPAFMNTHIHTDNPWSVTRYLLPCTYHLPLLALFLLFVRNNPWPSLLHVNTTHNPYIQFSSIFPSWSFINPPISISTSQPTFSTLNVPILVATKHIAYSHLVLSVSCPLSFALLHYSIPFSKFPLPVSSQIHHY